MCMYGFTLLHVYFAMTLREEGYGFSSLYLCPCFEDWDLVLTPRTDGGAGGESGDIVCAGTVGRRGGRVVLHFEHFHIMSDRHT